MNDSAIRRFLANDWSKILTLVVTTIAAVWNIGGWYTAFTTKVDSAVQVISTVEVQLTGLVSKHDRLDRANDRHEWTLADHEKRLNRLEAQRSGPSTITDGRRDPP